MILQRLPQKVKWFLLPKSTYKSKLFVTSRVPLLEDGFLDVHLILEQIANFPLDLAQELMPFRYQAAWLSESLLSTDARVIL